MKDVAKKKAPQAAEDPSSSPPKHQGKRERTDLEPVALSYKRGRKRRRKVDKESEQKAKEQKEEEVEEDRGEAEKEAKQQAKVEDSPEEGEERSLAEQDAQKSSIEHRHDSKSEDLSMFRPFVNSIVCPPVKSRFEARTSVDREFEDTGADAEASDHEQYILDILGLDHTSKFRQIAETSALTEAFGEEATAPNGDVFEDVGDVAEFVYIAGCRFIVKDCHKNILRQYAAASESGPNESEDGIDVEYWGTEYELGEINSMHGDFEERSIADQNVVV